MRTLRPIFLRPPLPDGLAPIYLALLALVTLSVLGFAAALWPHEPVAAASPPDKAEGMTPSRTMEGSVRRPPDAPAPRRSNWM